MYSLTMRFDLGEFATDLPAAEAALAPAAVKDVVGRAGVNILRDHFFDLDRSRKNDLGGKRSHFYAAAARSTQFQTRSSGVLISINKVGIAQRFYGGSIRPVKAKVLTIPVRSEAYGKSPREFTNLEVVFGKRGAIGLAERPSTDVNFGSRGVQPGQRRGGLLMYIFKTEVQQDPDPSVLPKDSEMSEGILDALREAKEVAKLWQ